MKISKKLLSLIAVLLAFAMLLTACGGQKAPGKEPDDEPEKEAKPIEKKEEAEDEATNPSLMWGVSGQGTAEKPEQSDESEEYPIDLQDTVCWDNEAEEMSLVVYPDGTAILSNTVTIIECTIEFDDRDVTLRTVMDGEDAVEYGVLNDDGSIQFEELDDPFVLVEDISFVPAESVDVGWSTEGTYNYRLEGSWTNSYDEDLKLTFDGVDTVVVSLGDESVTATYRFDGYEVELHAGEEVQMGQIDYEDDIWMDEADGWFVADKENYFKEYSIWENWDPEEMTTLQNGARYYYEDGTSYSTAPSDWGIEIIRDEEIGSGIREMEMTLYCGFSAENTPYFEGEFYYGCQNCFFDGYTGAFLDGDLYYDENDGFYKFDYVSNGRDIHVEYNFEVEWLEDYEGYENCMKMNATVRLPVKYDGIWMVALASEPTYAEYNAWYPTDLRPFEDTDLLYESLAYRIK